MVKLALTTVFICFALLSATTAAPTRQGAATTNHGTTTTVTSTHQEAASPAGHDATTVARIGTAVATVAKACLKCIGVSAATCYEACCECGDLESDPQLQSGHSQLAGQRYLSTEGEMRLAHRYVPPRLLYGDNQRVNQPSPTPPPSYHSHDNHDDRAHEYPPSAHRHSTSRNPIVR